jgi:hypothetical protein
LEHRFKRAVLRVEAFLISAEDDEDYGVLAGGRFESIG